MKKDRQKLEDALVLVVQDHSNDTKIISEVTNKLVEKGISRGKVVGLFTQAIPFSYMPQIELCLFTKYFYDSTYAEKINPDNYFNEIELQQAEIYQHFNEEKTNRIILHNVDQISDSQYLCTKETYQNIARYFDNGLLTYNPKTQRQPLKRRVGDKIIEVININPKKILEIKESMIQGTFNQNAIIFNVRRQTGMEKLKYNLKDRTLTIEVDGVSTLVDLIDGMHRCGGMLKTVEEKPDIDRLTSIFVYHVDEEKARQIIKQESKATPIDEEWLDVLDVTNPNMEVVKSINSKQRMNEMFNRIGLDNAELRRENKLVTFETLAKTIEHIFDLKDKPFIEAQGVETFLIDLFNIIVGIKHKEFNESLSQTRETSYIADNNTFIGYVSLGEELRKKYGEDNWKNKLVDILNKLDFDKPSDQWKRVGLENNLNLSTIKKITEYFINVVRSEI